MADPRLRVHMLRRNRSGRYAVKIDRRYRLIVVPLCEDGSRLDDEQTKPDGVTAMMVIEIVDYH